MNYGDYLSYIPRANAPGSIHGVNTKESFWIISADLGQANDYTAISVLERVITGGGVIGPDRNGERTINLVHLERTRGAEYPAIVDRLKQIYRSPALIDKTKAVVIDYTGLGRPVYDMMRQAGFYWSLNAISITGGNDMTQGDRSYNVPKRELVSALQIELQTNRLKIASGLKEKDALIEELSNFQTAISESGHDTYNGANGVHDDLVMSVAMGVWLACRPRCRWAAGKDM